MKILGEEKLSKVTYDDLGYGDVFVYEKCEIFGHHPRICMKTSLRLDYIENLENRAELEVIHKYFAVDLKTGFNFDMDPEMPVKKVNAYMKIED